MKKSLYVVSFLILLIVVFFGGARFSQRGAGQSTASTGERQILHYVDPMNPAHTTKEPGIAPCGMPMEPVYADQDTPGGSGVTGSALSASLGTVKINLQKQQIIGVQVGEVTRAAETNSIRALGRIAPDENRIYPLIAATDGWMEEINENTTGSLVKANQLMAQIKVYNSDFFTWQQRYLTELGYTGRISGSSSPLPGTDQGRRRRTSGSGYQAGLPPPDSEAQMTKPTAVTPQKTAADETPQITEPLSSSPNPMPQPENAPLGSPHHTGMDSAETENFAPKSRTDHSEHMENMPKEDSKELRANRENNLLYASKGRLELLNLGVEESQLQEFAKSGNYITHVDLRSPVDGYVLSRTISPLQKIDRGTECFRIADLGRVWIEADVYDLEAKYIQPGMEARISLPRQSKHFAATVSEVLPRFDAVSRSLKVRLEMDNPELFFRPDMFVDVEFLINLPESITVPSEAVIDSGKRKTVYVVIEEGIFEPRTVVTGWRSRDRVEIVEGLHPGEKIVVSGNFLIDSESRMKLAALRLMEDTAEQPLNVPVPVPPVTAAPQTVMPAMTKEAIESTVKDPVCGMTVDLEQAKTAGLTAEAEGKMYYFCSDDCKKQFEQAPHRYLTEKVDKQAQSNAPGHDGHQHD